jgi:predicted membrane channel-forming protein YqfA (hemolysin III family)
MTDYSDDAPESDDRMRKYIFGAIVAFALLAVPNSRFQDTFKILVWTAIVFGSYTPLVWPHIFDLLSRAVFALLVVVHLGIVCEAYPRISHEGYISISIVAIIELVLFSVPGGWLIVRSRAHKDNATGNNGKRVTKSDSL